MQRAGYLLIVLVCVAYWVLDSVLSYISFETNLKSLIFSEPVSWVDTFLLRVPPYQVVSRLMVIFLFVVLGSVIVRVFHIRQRAEEQRRIAHDSLLTILNSIDATVSVSDMETHEIRFMNQKMIDAFGGDFSGKACFQAFRNCSEPCADCKKEKLLDESNKPTGVIVWEGENPITKRWSVYYDRAIQWSDGQIVHLQIATDITELKELQKKQLLTEARLQQAQKMESIGNLAGGIAHDFNNILFPIMGLSELLMEDLPAGSMEHENAQEIFKAGKRGRDLVKQILAFSRQNENQKKPIRVQQVLAEVLKLSRSTIPADIEIHQRIQGDCGLVMADPTQVHQVAMNLITNAYHAVQKTGGKITVRLQQTHVARDDADHNGLTPGQYVVLTVSDDGSGMEKEVMDKIFEPYFTTKPQGKGTGLGLAVVYGIVNDYGGDIQVESRVGEGTTFRVFFPLMRRAFDAQAMEDATVYPGGTEHILLIDDEPSILRYETEMLTRLGYRITSRVNGVEALAAFQDHPNEFDLVITDMSMPNMTGEELARQLILIRFDIPIIICTGFSERIDRKKASEMGVKGFLLKPIVRSKMAKLVRSVIDGQLP